MDEVEQLAREMGVSAPWGLVDSLRKALAFYAAPENWERRVTPESAPYCLAPTISNDLGRTARMALGIPEPETNEPPF